jgi:PAS domain S-box-containing protein
MLSLRNIPLQKKLLRIIILASGIALLLTVAAFVIYDMTTFRSRIQQNLVGISQLYNKTLPATLIFNDPKAAEENLSTIETQSEVKMICVYKPNGKMFAKYVRNGLKRDNCPKKITMTEKQFFRGTEYQSYQPIKFSNEVIGYMFIRCQLPPLLDRMIGYGSITAVVILSLLFTSIVLALGLQKYVSGPIIQLEHMASKISSEGQFHLRAVKHGQDEIGSLTDAFNKMLNTIEGTITSLHESETRFRRVSESNMLGIFFCDMEGMVTEANDYFLEMLGYSREDLANNKLNWQHLTPEEYHYLDVQAGQELKELRMCHPYEKEYIRKDGTRVSILLGSALLEGSQSDLVAFALDITQMKLVEKEIEKLLVTEKKARADAEVSLQLREDFMSIAAHELRTPLTPLKLQLEFIKKSLYKLAETSPNIKSLLNLMGSSDQQINRLSRLIEDMLDVSRMRTGRFTLNLEAVDLSDLVNNVVNRYHLEMERLNIKVNLEIKDHLLGNWDEQRLEQVLVNLISNAIKYGNSKPIFVTTQRCQDGACLIVRDQGIGIDIKDQTRIFNRFERAVSKEHFGGFGLGLYITRQIVEAHHGTIKVSSRPGDGTTFTVKLPFKTLNQRIVNEDRANPHH